MYVLVLCWEPPIVLYLEIANLILIADLIVIDAISQFPSSSTWSQGVFFLHEMRTIMQ